MKILHVSESLIGGLASYLEEIIPHQTAQFGADNVVLLVPAAQREHIASLNGCAIETYHRTGRNLSSMLALGSAIRQSIQRHDPDVVHLHSSIAGGMGRLVIAAMRRKPHVVYCAHCWAFDRPEQTFATRFWMALERMLTRRADAIVSISPHEEEVLRRARFPLAKTRLIVSGMQDLVHGQTAQRGAAKRVGPWRLLFVGRLDRQKGVDLLLREYELLKQKRASLSLVGSKIVNSSRLVVPPEVHVSGWVPRETLPALFEEYDAIIMPSRWEGMPLLAIEALRSGRILICSNHGAFPHFIQDGVNGILIDIATTGWLGKALKVLEHSDLAAMSAAARTTYLAMFAPDRMNQGLIELYESLVKRPRLQSEATATPRDRLPVPERVVHSTAMGRDRHGSGQLDTLERPAG